MPERGIFRKYLDAIGRSLAQGDATEESLYPNLSELLSEYAAATDRSEVPKWLKDRKDRTLTLDDIRTYCRIVTALSKTIEAQAEIDGLYLAVDDDILAYPDVH